MKDIVIINYEISTCLAKYSRAEWYVLIDQLFKESLFLVGSSVKIMRNQDFFILQPFHKNSVLLLSSWE